MIFEFEHPLLGLYLTSEQNFDYWTYFQLGFSFSFKANICAILDLTKKKEKFYAGIGQINQATDRSKIFEC